MPVIVLAGRPYHLDGGDQPRHRPASSPTAARSSCPRTAWAHEYVKAPTTVLNQWTYHARLYAAARFIAESGDPHMQPGAARLLRLRRGRHHHRRGRARSSNPSGKHLHADQDRRDHQPGRGQDPPAQPVLGASERREAMPMPDKRVPDERDRIEFTKEMRRTYTILIPNMAADPLPHPAERAARLRLQRGAADQRRARTSWTRASSTSTTTPATRRCSSSAR